MLVFGVCMYLGVGMDVEFLWDFKFVVMIWIILYKFVLYILGLEEVIVICFGDKEGGKGKVMRELMRIWGLGCWSFVNIWNCFV